MEVKFIQKIHNKTKRNCLGRMVSSKTKNMHIARKFERSFFDGKRDYGYGGYKYIKDYYKDTAIKLIKHYKLNNNSKILDIGCGKGYLLFEIQKIIPKAKICGFDISKYAILNSKKEVKKFLFNFDLSKKLSFAKTNEYDLVICIATLHNLNLEDAFSALKEIERISIKKYLVVDSYRTLNELFNLQCWALTANIFFSNSDWKFFFNLSKYKGDYEFIHF
jgi:SAM-dependent methyltransferase